MRPLCPTIHLSRGGNPQAPSRRTLAVVDVIDLGHLDYRAAWERQRVEHAEVVAGGADRVLLVQHPPVFTCG